METMDVEHRKLIEEENVNINDLPSEIRAKMRGYNLNLNNYVSNPSPTAKKTVVKLDVEIADMIQTWLDDKLGEAEELDSNDDNTSKFSKKTIVPDSEPEPAPPVEPEPIPTPPVEPEPIPTPPVEPEPTPAPPAEPEMDANEKALREQWINGVITIPALRALLGREPNYPNQKVGNVTMRKTYGRDEYKQIS